MKFKNVSNDVKNLKKSDGWVSLNPQEVIDINKRIDLNEEGLELVENKALRERKEDNPIKSKVKKKKPQTKDFKPLTKEQLKNMTKDELNDYAAINGVTKKVSHRMLKKDMIKNIIKYLGIL